MAAAVRRASRADVPRLVEIHARCYPDGRGEEERARRFERNPLGGLADAWVVETAGDVAGHAFLFSLGAFFGGALVPVGAIASVGVAPEARGRGLGSHLVRELAALSGARGDALTVLHAVRARFYERLGWSPPAPYASLEVDPRSLPDGPPGTIRSASGPDRAAIEALYAAHAATRTGQIARPAALWDARFSDPRLAYFVATQGDRLTGYAAYRLLEQAAHGGVAIDVDDLVAADGATRRALLAHLRAQRDQVHTVRMDLPIDDPLLFALVDPDPHGRGTPQNPHAFATLGAGPMLRLAGPEALLARGWPADGAIAFSLPGENGRAQPFAIRASGGRASRVEADGLPVVELDLRALASIAFGGLAVSRARALGLVAGNDDAVAAAGRLLDLPAYFSPDPF